jgi:hypothetical protein
VNAAADSYVDSSTPNANNGTATRLLLQGTTGDIRRSFLRFNLPTVPPGCAVTSASLVLVNDLGGRGSNEPIVVQRVTASWAEGGVTWVAQPTFTTAGASTATTTPIGLGTRTTWNVTAIVSAQYAGSNFGVRVALVNESSDAERVWGARENPVGERRPTLTVAWG